MEMDADNQDIFTHQNIPRRVGCPCQTTSSWSDAPARPQGGPQRHRSEDKEITMQLGSRFNPRFSSVLSLFPLTYHRKCKNAHAGGKKYTDFRLKRFAKIKLSQIRTKLARSSVKPSSFTNMQWMVFSQPVPSERDLTLARAPVVEHILLYKHAKTL